MMSDAESVVRMSEHTSGCRYSFGSRPSLMSSRLPRIEGDYRVATKALKRPLVECIG
jgi:hypothetical protein